MSIICIEGASAVGKTTLSNYFKNNYNAYVVDEVNLLYSRPSKPPSNWYFDRQVDRWELALAATISHQYTILDGDCFQPFWYNWAYDFNCFSDQTLTAIFEFYSDKIKQNKISFPDKYFILHTSVEKLKHRKLEDINRKRRKFDEHLKFIKPQIAFFNMIKNFNYKLVDFIEHNNVAETAQLVLKIIKDDSISKTTDDEGLLLHIFKWLQANRAELSQQNYFTTL